MTGAAVAWVDGLLVLDLGELRFVWSPVEVTALAPHLGGPVGEMVAGALASADRGFNGNGSSSIWPTAPARSVEGLPRRARRRSPGASPGGDL